MPAVEEYWKAFGPCSATTRSIDFKSSSSGNEMGLGNPPANEVTFGSDAALRMLRTKEGGVDLIPSESSASVSKRDAVSFIRFLPRALMLVLLSRALLTLAR